MRGEGVTVETWLLDFTGDLYGQNIRIALHEFLRPEQKFDTLSELRDEILRNAQQTRACFAAHPDMEREEYI